MHLMRSEAIHLSDHAHLALTAGFLGALTTFSTFGYETVHHLEEGEWALAGVNVAANLVLGLLAAGGGVAVGRAFG
jgi:CrcB protein